MRNIAQTFFIFLTFPNQTLARMGFRKTVCAVHDGKQAGLLIYVTDLLENVQKTKIVAIKEIVSDSAY